MKKKVFCFKRAVSLLLAAAMILTAAPQTGIAAFAAENSDSQVLSVDDTLADAENDKNDADVDTTQPEDGQDETQLPEEPGDGSENGGDVLQEDPGQEGNPDDAEEPEEVTEPADEQESDGEAPAAIVSEEEIVSENLLAAELMGDGEQENPEEPEEYVGSTREDERDGITYNVLEISSFERGDLNDNQPWTDEQILEKLEKWKEKEEKFGGVQLWINDTGVDSRVIKKDLLNAAIELLNTEDNEAGWWIDYTFHKQEGSEKEYTNFFLYKPSTVSADISTDVTVTPVAGQGVKLMFPAVDFGAEHVVVNFCSSENWDEIKAILEGAGGEGEWQYSPYCQFTLESGEPELFEDHVSYNVDCDMDDERFWVCDLRPLKANTEYLMAPVKNAEGINVGETRKLTLPEGATDIVWKTYTPDVISINNETGELSAQNRGEALYGVIYKENGEQKFQFYRLKVEELEYVGWIKQEENWDGTNYTVLEIGAFERMDLNDGKPWTDAQILEKLEKWKEKEERFGRVRLVINDTGAESRVIKKDLLNTAVGLLNIENTEAGCWIDYNFQKYEPEKEDAWEGMGFSLYKPGPVNADINANVTVTPVAGQGVKLNFPAVDFNAEHVTVNFGQLANWDEINKCLEGAGGEGNENPYRLFPLKSGQPEADDQEIYLYYNADCDMSDKRFWVCDVRRLKADTEYLMAPVKNVESMNVGEKKTLTPPVAGAANVTWKSYTPDVISINTQNGELSALNRGEALYGVTYKESNVQKAQFYRLKVESELYKIDFLDKEIEMEVSRDWSNEAYLNVVCYPSEAGVDSGDLQWSIEPEESNVIEFVYEDGKMRGGIRAIDPGTATVKATYHGKKDLTATCTITVKGILDWDAVEEEVNSMDLYAVSGCDTKLSDVKFPTGTASKWEWKDPNLSLAPYAGLEGHLFTAICTRDGGWSGEHTLWVRMINVTGINMQQRMPAENGSGWTDWNPWWIPTTLEKGDKLSLGFYYNLENGDYEQIKEKLAGKYKVEWSSSPNNLGVQKDDGTYEYTASVSGKKTEKKTFTVSLKDKTANKVVWKASHTLTVTPNPLFGDDNWKLIDEAWKAKEEKIDTGKLTELTLKIGMSKEDYDKWKLKFESLDTGILKLGRLAVTEETSTAEGKETKTTVVKIPCTQNSFGRVWIKVTAQDDDKSSQTYVINLEDPAPTLLGAATQTINKASTERSVPIVVSTSEHFPLVKKTNGTPDVSIQEVKIGSKVASDWFELTDVKEVKEEEAAALLEEGDSDGEGGDSAPETYIGIYSMKLGLKGNDLSGVKAGNYAVKLKCKTTAAKDNEYTLSLTVKVTDVKPKVTFKQTKKVNLFYTNDEGAGTLQINTSEEITKVELKNYVDNKNSNKNADCHYELKNVDGVYKIARKPGQNGAQPDGSLKKGILEYEVKGYTGTFQTTFTVATENKAPAIVLSTKSDTLYPGVGYYDSWISMTNKATGKSFVPDEAIWYTGKNQNRKEEKLTIGKFGNPDSDEQKNKEKEITGAKGNKYGLFVTDDGKIVSRLRNADSYDKKADTINLELRKDNWSKPVAVSYKLQVNSAIPKLALGKATLTLNKNADVYRGQQERTTLRLKGFNDLLGNDVSWVTITGQDDKSRAELIGENSSLAIWYWDNCGDVVVRFNDNDIEAGTYKYKISVGKNGERSEYASTVLTVKIVDKTVKQSLKVTAKGSIDVLNREGTFIAYTPKISNLTGTVVDGRLAGKDANLFDWSFENGKLIVKAQEWTIYSTKITYEVHTVFRVQTENWRDYEVSSDNAANAKPFKIKVKQGKPKLKATAVNGNILYRQRNNSVEFRLSAVLGKQDVVIGGAWQTDYYNDLWMEYDGKTQIVRVNLINGNWGEIRKNGTYKPKIAVYYRDKAGDVKVAQITCPIVVR